MITMRRLCIAIAALLCVAAHPAASQDYPTRTITMIVPFPPGGGNDTMARIVASKLSAALGQQIVVDNRPGANGVIAMRAAARAAPDGTTIVFANTARPPSISLNRTPATTPKKISRRSDVASTSIGIIMSALPANNVAEFIALPKREPDKLSIGTSRRPAAARICRPSCSRRAPASRHLPYKGRAGNDLIGGHPAVFSVLPASLGAIRAGTSRSRR